jgi:hypothetical protein
MLVDPERPNEYFVNTPANIFRIHRFGREPGRQE